MNLKLSALIATGLLGATSLALAQGPTSSGSGTGNANLVTHNGTSSSGTNGTTNGTNGAMSNGGSNVSTSPGTSSDSNESGGKMTGKEFMKECMQMGKSANNGMSKMDMRKSCHQQYHKYKAGEQQEPMAPQPNP